MKLLIKYHQLAWSIRTLRMYVKVYNQNGKYLNQYFYTCKCACMIKIPDESAYAIKFYTSNSGLPYTEVFKIVPNSSGYYELETIAYIGQQNLEYIDQYQNDMKHDIQQWLLTGEINT